MIPSLSDLPGPPPRNDRMIALFLFGVVTFNPPLLQVFGVPGTVFGLPVIGLYLFAVWGGLIGLIAADVERRNAPRDGKRRS